MSNVDALVKLAYSYGDERKSITAPAITTAAGGMVALEASKNIEKDYKGSVTLSNGKDHKGPIKAKYHKVNKLKAYGKAAIMAGAGALALSGAKKLKDRVDARKDAARYYGR